MNDSREWLEADGAGGFAMGTADGIRTRRYHALLCTATQPPEGRMVLVADLEVFVETNAGRFALSSHRYRGDVVHPDGATRMFSFAVLVDGPVTTWSLSDGTMIACELVVSNPHVAIKWTRIAGAGAASLSVRPLLAGRDYHALHHENPAFRFDAEVDGDRVTWRPYEGVPSIHAIANGRYDHAPDWYRGFLYTEERARGLDHEEDLASPGTFTFDLANGPAAVAFSAQPIDTGKALPLVEGTFRTETSRRAKFASELHQAADAYIVTRGRGQTIIAGYPWFADWGRDTFISLRGLCLAVGRRDVARRILLEWAGVVSEGMLPNRFDEHAGTPEYNSVDAALWFVIAADAYLGAAGSDDPAGASDPDRPALEKAIDDIVAGYARGTRHRIAAGFDGLLACGEPGLQLTWMDAKVGGQVITPRIGKPVEVQALWLNALAIAGRRTAHWNQLFDRGCAAFEKRFWNDGQLFDVIDCDHVEGKVDASCRPNQIFAIGGLPLALLEGPRARAVVDAAFRELWTPAGPRTLSPSDPRYCGRYTGGPLERDRSYHNGPVWPWLAGPFIEAWVRVRGRTADAKREARDQFLGPLLERLELAGLGHLSEIAEGDPPHRAVGCPFQAWSLAEALRLDLDVLA